MKVNPDNIDYLHTFRNSNSINKKDSDNRNILIWYLKYAPIIDVKIVKLLIKSGVKMQ